MSDLVIAVDEAGDFRASSSLDHFYVAAIVRPGKEEQYQRWEAGIPARNRKEDGEVKGGYLTDDRQHDFVREVICASPRVIITRVAIQPSMHPPGSLRAHQAATVKLAQESAARFKRHGNAGMVAEASGFARWLQRMQEPQYMKLALQTEVVAQSLADAVGHAVTGGFDLELPSLRYKIDRGVLGDSPEDRRYWKRFIATQVRRLPEDTALVSLDTWEATGHPFLDLYRHGSGWDLNPLFDERCDFVSSRDHYQLRIADIVASLHRLFYMSKDEQWKTRSAYARMERRRAFARSGTPWGRMKKVLLLDPARSVAASRERIGHDPASPD